jgi:isoquinoline 1-oxidoreductase beta subunit
MKPPSSFSRRDFFRLSSLAGGGLMLGYALPSKALGQSPAKPKALAAFAPNHFIKITSGGKITLVAKIPDMGQGIKTALPMILAEELGVHLTQVHLEYGRLNSNLGPQDSGGSMSIFDNYQPHRIAGAMARTLLISAAAESWQVPASECRAKHGMPPCCPFPQKTPSFSKTPENTPCWGPASAAYTTAPLLPANRCLASIKLSPACGTPFT